MPSKSMNIPPEIASIIATMEWSQHNRSIAGKLTTGQLDRDTYTAVDKALKVLGGKWNRSAGAHLFPTDPRPQLEEIIGNGTITIERDGYFPTPKSLGHRMAKLADIYPHMLVLEPSAGTGELAEAILEVAPFCELSVIEKNEQRAELLKQKGYNLIGHDFLTHHQTWDRIIQNPPFEELQDIDHVCYAYEHLKSAGILVSIMSPSPFFREDKKCVGFRKWLEGTYSHAVFDLERGIFKESGTMVSAKLVIIRKR